MHRIIVVTTLMFCISGCDLQKIDDHFRGPIKLHGTNAATGGITYSYGDFGKDLDRYASTCRAGEAKSGEMAIRLGTGVSDLPLTVIQQTNGEVSMKFQSPRGVIDYGKPDCSTLKFALSSDHRELSGTVTFDCEKEEHVIRGSVRFERCGN